MAIGPRFSANRIQSVLKSALGVGSDGVRSALSRIGKQDVLGSSRLTSVKDARVILKKLESTGAVSDVTHARNEFRKAERVAETIDRVRKEANKTEFLSQRNSAESVVREQLHSVSISEDANRTKRAVSVASLQKKSSNGAHQTISKDAGTQQVVKPLLDIPFD